MSMPRPVVLEAMPAMPTTDIPDAAPHELLEPSPVAEIELAAETSGSALSKLASYAGELVNKAAIYTSIKTDAAMDYLKLKGGKIAARAYLAALAVTGGGGLAAFLDTHTAEAASGPQYTVAGTAAGGVYSRNTPHTADTPRIPGQGVYPGDNLTLECGVTDGDPLGPYNNHTWYYAHDNSRNEPDFWVNDHNMNTPTVANQMAPGVVSCPNESSNPMAVQYEPAPPPPPQPWDISTTSEHTYIDHVTWINTPFGKSLHVFVTPRGYVESFVVPASAFGEVMRDAHLPYSDSMFNQFECHADIAPPGRLKPSWNLDTWRPDVGLPQTIQDLCNPQPGEQREG